MTEAAPTFRFRLYREEVALRSSWRQSRAGRDGESNFHTANCVEHVTPKGDDITARTGLTTAHDDSCDDSGGNVIQNLSSAIVLVDLNGNVLMQKKNCDKKIIKTNDHGIGTNNDRGEAIFVLQKRTTLLLRNLRDCHVTM